MTSHNARPGATRRSAGGPVVIGVDLGGTKILGHAVDLADPLAPRLTARVPTPTGGVAIVDAIGEVASHLTARLTAPVAAMGVGAAGLVDLDGVLRFAPNLPTVANLDLARPLRTALGVPVVVGNDASCAMAAEHRLGAAKGARDALLVTIGTGIGAGIVVDGGLQLGGGGFAGEPGHMVVDPDGPRCPCGRRGCWEQMASGSSLGRLGREAAASGRAAGIVARAGGDPQAIRGEHVSQAALDGDAEAGELIERLAWWLGLGLANLVDLLDPELIVIGGGLVACGDLLLGPVREALRGQVVAAEHRPPVRIEPALLGPEAGAVGAALLAGDLVDTAGRFGAVT
jgi:glucokinase